MFYIWGCLKWLASFWFPFKPTQKRYPQKQHPETQVDLRAPGALVGIDASVRFIIVGEIENLQRHGCNFGPWWKPSFDRLVSGDNLSTFEHDGSVTTWPGAAFSPRWISVMRSWLQALLAKKGPKQFHPPTYQQRQTQSNKAANKKAHMHTITMKQGSKSESTHAHNHNQTRQQVRTNHKQARKQASKQAIKQANYILRACVVLFFLLFTNEYCLLYLCFVALLWFSFCYFARLAIHFGATALWNSILLI